MTMRLPMLMLRQYRFELGFAVLAAVIATALGLSIDLRIDALGVSQECIDRVRSGNVEEDPWQDTCWLMVRAGSEILEGGFAPFLNSHGTLQGSVMGLLPFVVGMFGGIPVVARELEDRTAQTAWWLNASRSLWLLQRLGVIGLVLALPIALAALVASPVADDWLRWYGAERAGLVGTHGPLVVVRAIGAFGVGLAMGATLGRTFPAFVASVAILLLAMVVGMQARDVWLAHLPFEPLYRQSTVTGVWEPIGGVPRAVAWGGPAGEVLTPERARQRAADLGGFPPAPADESIEAAVYEWLYGNGYAEITLGVSDEAAAGWAPFDGGLFATLGLTGLAATFVVVNRRRPT